MNTHPTTRRVFQLAALAGAVALSTGLASAQTFPDKPIKIVVGAPAGGTADIFARVLSQGMSELLGQPVVVDNKPGAAGLLGAQALLQAPRDGHTLMVSVNGLVSEVPHVIKVPFDPLTALRPLVDLGRTGLVLVGTPSVPAADVKGVAAHIKANPGKISFASYSTGTLSHTLGLEFNKLFGTDMVHVGYRGSPPALVDVMGGTVSYMFDGPATSVPLIQDGKLKAFATTAPKRLSALPNVPTFAELGHDALTEVAWIGLWTTPDVPAAHQTVIRNAAIKVLQNPKVREQFAKQGFEEPSTATPEQLIASLKAASDKQAATLKAIGFQPQ